MVETVLKQDVLDVVMPNPQIKPKHEIEFTNPFGVFCFNVLLVLLCKIQSALDVRLYLKRLLDFS